jgi:predicted nucleic acid-binding protein
MLVVSDASPLNILIRIECIDVLPKLYGQVFVPSAVAAEMGDPKAPAVVRNFITSPPEWLVIRAPENLLALTGIDLGERAAISLARQLNADLLLIDEKRGRRVALDMHLRIIGTIGLLEIAAIRGLLDLAVMVKRIRQTDFSVSEAILQAALQRDAERKAR